MQSQQPDVGDRLHEGGPKLPVCELDELIWAVRWLTLDRQIGKDQNNND